MSDAGLSESERALAQSNYDEPRWPLARAIVWFGSPKIEALAHYEATFFGRTLARITKQQVRANARKSEFVLRALGCSDAAVGTAEGLASHNQDEVDELLGALRWGKLQAIGPDNKPLPPEFWDDQSSVDPRKWPNVRFWRDDVLRERPAASTSDGEAGGEELRPNVISAAAELPKFGHDEPSIARLSEFLKRHYGDAQHRRETTNREKAKKAAENEFRAEIDWKTFHEAFRRAKIVNQGGRPKKPAKNS
jgi:hypothetical protein